MYICFSVANKLTTAANAIVLQFTCPVFLVLLEAFLFHQKIRKRDMSVVLIVLFGIALFFFDQLSPSGIAGNFVAIAAGMFMAGMFLTIGNLAPSELGVFQLGIPYVLYAIASKDCPPLACSLLSAFEPLLNPVWVMIFDGEKPGLFALIGGLIVIISITVWVIQGQKEPA